MDQAFREEDHALGEVVLGEPGHHALLLHVRTASDVDDQVAQVLPVSGHKHSHRDFNQTCIVLVPLDEFLINIYIYITVTR